MINVRPHATDSVTGKENVLKFNDGLHTRIQSINPDVMSQKQVIIEHVPLGTAATDPIAGSSWINLRGFTSGRVWLKVVDGTPAGDLTGNLEVSYSHDGGVNSTEWFTVKALSNPGADDSQDIVVELSDLTASSDTAGFTKLIKNMPFAKFRLDFTAGTLAAVTVGIIVILERY